MGRRGKEPVPECICIGKRADACGDEARVSTTATRLSVKSDPYVGLFWAHFLRNNCKRTRPERTLPQLVLRDGLSEGSLRADSVDGLFMWGAGFRGCAEPWECKGNGTCTADGITTHSFIHSASTDSHVDLHAFHPQTPLR